MKKIDKRVTKYVVVDTEKGEQFAKVVDPEIEDTKKLSVDDMKGVLRVSTKADYNTYMRNLKDAKEALDLLFKSVIHNSADLEKNENNLVYFELTGERESFNKLEIAPKPDSLLRVAIHVKKINGKQTIKEQKLESFERNGFVAVEWGGIAYK